MGKIVTFNLGRCIADLCYVLAGVVIGYFIWGHK